MGFRISTPINVMLFESREVPLKLRFTLLMRKFIIESFARDCNSVIEKLDLLKFASSSKNVRIKLLHSFPIFKQYIFISHYRNIIHKTPFPPYFFSEFNAALFHIKPCMAMYPIDGDLSPAAINNIFQKKII